MLSPILLASVGRSGSTALMALLATDERVRFDRAYPYENRHLTYLAKCGLLYGRPGVRPYFDYEQMNDYTEMVSGPPPWPINMPEYADAQRDWHVMTPTQWFFAGWATFTELARRRFPDADRYGEKAPPWLAGFLRPLLPTDTVYLTRDPRDLYLSAAAFLKAIGYQKGFGRKPGDAERVHAVGLTHALLEFYENERLDRVRADSFRSRYEDYVADPAAVAAEWGRRLRVSLEVGSVASAPGRHFTSASASESVGRWKREGLPPGVCQVLEAHLGELLTDYEYEPASEAPAQVWTMSEVVAAGPTVSADGSWVVDGDSARVTVTGGDAFIELPIDPFPAESAAEIWLCLQADTGDHASLFWRRPGDGWSEARRLHRSVYAGAQYQIIRFIVAGHHEWHGIISGLRVDVFNGSVEAGKGGRVRWVRKVR